MILRDYQSYAIQCVLDYYLVEGKTGNPLVCAPTGTGKSLMIAGLIKELFFRWPSIRLMMVTDVKELIEQDYDKLLDLWPTAPAGIYSDGLKQKDTKHPIIFGGIGSVANVPLYFGKIDFLLVDEAHMISLKENSQYRSFIDHLKTVNPHLVVIGFTATKFRMGQGLLTEGESALFSDICCDMTTMEAFNWFLDEGYLCRLRPVPTNTEYDVTGVRTVAGEYHKGDLEKAVDKEDLTRKVVSEAIKWGEAEDRKCWLVFSSGVKHAIHVAEELNAQGISTTYIHSNSKEFPMSSGERDKRIADFKAGKYKCMVNNGILTKGFDHPKIDYIVMLRKTKSIVLWIQMLGRGTRPFYMFGFDLSTKEGRLDAIFNGEKPYCLVADFAANIRELGPINDPAIPKPKGKKAKIGDVPIRICGKCGTYNHAAATHCSHCGYEFPRMTKLQLQASTDALIREAVTEVKPIEVKIFPVNRVEYSPHFKNGTFPSIKVTYYCGLRRFIEYQCPEHGGGATGRFKNWWRARTNVDIPQTTVEALQSIHSLTVPSQIHVRMDTKYPQVINYEYEQTNSLVPA